MSHDAIDRIIREYGVFIQAVFGTLPDEPRFAYTIGNHERGYPELIVFGLSQNDAGFVLNSLVAMVRGGELHPTDGERVQLLDTDITVELRSVLPQWAFTFGRQAFVRAGSSEPAAIPFLQVVVPDSEGRFPEDDGCAPDVAESQPDLRSDVPWAEPYRAPEELNPLPEEADAAALLPIRFRGEPEGRWEAVPVRREGGRSEVLAPPVFADYVTAGTIIETDAPHEPINGSELPLVRFREVERQSSRVHLRWRLQVADEDQLEHAQGALDRIGDLADTVFSTSVASVQVAAGSRDAQKVRSIMRRLERDGIAHEMPLYHDPSPRR